MRKERILVVDQVDPVGATSLSSNVRDQDRNKTSNILSRFRPHPPSLRLTMWISTGPHHHPFIFLLLITVSCYPIIVDSCQLSPDCGGGVTLCHLFIDNSTSIQIPPDLSADVILSSECRPYLPYAGENRDIDFIPCTDSLDCPVEMYCPFGTQANGYCQNLNLDCSEWTDINTEDPCLQLSITDSLPPIVCLQREPFGLNPRQTACTRASTALWLSRHPTSGDNSTVAGSPVRYCTATIKDCQQDEICVQQDGSTVLTFDSNPGIVEGEEGDDTTSLSSNFTVGSCLRVSEVTVLFCLDDDDCQPLAVSPPFRPMCVVDEAINPKPICQGCLTNSDCRRFNFGLERGFCNSTSRNCIYPPPPDPDSIETTCPGGLASQCTNTSHTNPSDDATLCLVDIDQVDPDWANVTHPCTTAPEAFALIGLGFPCLDDRGCSQPGPRPRCSTHPFISNDTWTCSGCQIHDDCQGLLFPADNHHPTNLSRSYQCHAPSHLCTIACDGPCPSTQDTIQPACWGTTHDSRQCLPFWSILNQSQTTFPNSTLTLGSACQLDSDCPSSSGGPPLTCLDLSSFGQSPPETDRRVCLDCTVTHCPLQLPPNTHHHSCPWPMTPVNGTCSFPSSFLEDYGRGPGLGPSACGPSGFCVNQSTSTSFLVDPDSGTKWEETCPSSSCWCLPGWTGRACLTVVEDVLRHCQTQTTIVCPGLGLVPSSDNPPVCQSPRLPCGPHGEWDTSQQVCRCQDGWTTTDLTRPCSTSLIELGFGPTHRFWCRSEDDGLHLCWCQEGWSTRLSPDRLGQRVLLITSTNLTSLKTTPFCNTSTVAVVSPATSPSFPLKTRLLHQGRAWDRQLPACSATCVHGQCQPDTGECLCDQGFGTADLAIIGQLSLASLLYPGHSFPAKTTVREWVEAGGQYVLGGDGSPMTGRDIIQCSVRQPLTNTRPEEDQPTPVAITDQPCQIECPLDRGLCTDTDQGQDTCLCHRDFQGNQCQEDRPLPPTPCHCPTSRTEPGSVCPDCTCQSMWSDSTLSNLPSCIVPRTPCAISVCPQKCVLLSQSTSLVTRQDWPSVEDIETTASQLNLSLMSSVEGTFGWLDMFADRFGLVPSCTDHETTSEEPAVGHDDLAARAAALANRLLTLTTEPDPTWDDRRRQRVILGRVSPIGPSMLLSANTTSILRNDSGLSGSLSLSAEEDLPPSEQSHWRTWTRDRHLLPLTNSEALGFQTLSEQRLFKTKDLPLSIERLSLPQTSSDSLNWPSFVPPTSWSGDRPPQSRSNDFSVLVHVQPWVLALSVYSFHNDTRLSSTPTMTEERLLLAEEHVSQVLAWLSEQDPSSPLVSKGLLHFQSSLSLGSLWLGRQSRSREWPADLHDGRLVLSQLTTSFTNVTLVRLVAPTLSRLGHLYLCHRETGAVEPCLVPFETVQLGPDQIHQFLTITYGMSVWWFKAHSQETLDQCLQTASNYDESLMVTLEHLDQLCSSHT